MSLTCVVPRGEKSPSRRLMYKERGVQHPYAKPRSPLPIAIAHWPKYIVDNVACMSRAPEVLRRDRTFVVLAVVARPDSLQHASDELKDDVDVVALAAYILPAAVRFASQRVRDVLKYGVTPVHAERADRILRAMRGDLSLSTATDDDLRDRSMVLAAVARDGMELRFATREQKDDGFLVEAAVSRNPLALRHASRRIKRATKHATRFPHG